MPVAGAAGFMLGLLQFYLDTLLFPTVFAAKYGKTALLLAGKALLYAAALTLLLMRFREYALPAGIGFGAGMLLGMLAFAVVKLFKKGGDTG